MVKAESIRKARCTKKGRVYRKGTYGDTPSKVIRSPVCARKPRIVSNSRNKKLVLDRKTKTVRPRQTRSDKGKPRNNLNKADTKAIAHLRGRSMRKKQGRYYRDPSPTY